MDETVDAAVSAIGLTKRFQQLCAVDGISFDIAPGEIFGLVGPDGAGKTTTMRMLAGVLAPDQGTAIVAGADVARDPEAVKRSISYMPQRFGLYEDLTVDENIRFYADLFGIDRQTRERNAQRLLEASGMLEFRTRLAGKLSGGMKQKLGLTCALIHRPRIILLDEPTTGVDPVSRRDFWRILYAMLAEGVAILVATCYLDEADRCHRLALMHEGRILFSGSPHELKSRLPGGVISITTSDARAAAAELASADGVGTALVRGDELRLMVDDPRRRIDRLRARLEAASIPFRAVVEVPPSVEDVFVDSISRLRGAERAV
jgi:drug efflux transport system ATP-binding protein